MGLFGKKIPDGIRVVFYEGDLEGFQCDFASQLLLMDDILRITKINPYVEARLDRNRISSIDIFSEIEYMAKYKGVSVQPSKGKRLPKEYYVINYVNKSGEKKHLDFWGTASETLKIRKMREQIQKDKTSQSYDI